MQKPKPYVGMTGPSNADEVKEVVSIFECAGYNISGSKHIPMIGFLVSYERLRNLPDNDRRYPEFSNLASLLGNTQGKVFNTIHYNTKNQHNLADELIEVFNYQDIYKRNLCRGVQLNVVWPELDQVKKLKSKFPELQIILQANRKMTKGRVPDEFVEEIQKYQNLISYILIDPSGGKGEEFDNDKCVELYNLISDSMPNVTIGIAGGLSGENVIDKTSDLSNLLFTSDFCIDAEGQLRDHREDAKGYLNLEKVRDYLLGAAQVLD